MKRMTIKKKYAKAKGSRAERQWVDQLRRIYPESKQREKVKRVPMSGASWMKGDVVDLNDYDSLYEVKNQETLSISSWWRQTVREAAGRTPILVITQAYRPFIVAMRPEDLMSMIDNSVFKGCFKMKEHGAQVGLFDAVEPLTIVHLTIARDKTGAEWYVISGDDYIEIKKDLLTN